MEIKQWKCEKGHVLGVVVGGRLMLYREAQDNGASGGAEVIAQVEGTVVDVRCSVCGCVRTWYYKREVIR